MTGSSGWIASPDEDNDGWYDFNNDCHWTIEVDPSKSILFQILYVLTDPYQKQDGTVSYSRGTVVYTERQQDLLTACSDRLVVTHYYF